MAEELKLFKPGCIGTCWYGKYHYLEPWAGCGHDCLYCYARFRGEVKNSLAKLKTGFNAPKPLFKESRLIEEIGKEAASGRIKILKLCRYTDIFTPSFAAGGLSHEIISSLVSSKVDRIIITTKGIPASNTLELIKKNKDKFSYNIIAKPGFKPALEKSVCSIEERLQAAAFLAGAGVLTTVHMDPLIPGCEDREEAVAAHLKKLKKYRLKRVMFSYLLLNAPAFSLMKSCAGDEFAAELASYYDDKVFEILPGQEETRYSLCRPEFRQKSIDMISRHLSAMGFEFVLCSLKNLKGPVKIDRGLCKICDGNFYA